MDKKGFITLGPVLLLLEKDITGATLNSYFIIAWVCILSYILIIEKLQNRAWFYVSLNVQIQLNINCLTCHVCSNIFENTFEFAQVEKLKMN